MTDKIKEIADEVRVIKFAFIGKDREKVARLEVLALKIEALNESSEIARLRGIIERAKLVALKSLHVRGEVIDILSEADEQ